MRDAFFINRLFIMPITKIRKATIDDLNEVLILFTGTVKNTCKEDYNPKKIAAWLKSAENKKRWEDAIVNQYFILAGQDEKLVGFGSLENPNYIDFMYVNHSFLRNGIASIIFQNLMDKALRNNCQFVISDVSITAKPFFESKGFKVVKENRNLAHGVELINYRMKKDL